LVISNGEFGERLLDHARRWGLEFIEYRLAWGGSLDIASINKFLSANPKVHWLWTVACETSTGICNPCKKLADYCQAHQIAFCLDAVSAIGATPLHLDRVLFASGVSGKALGAYPGIACVFYNGPLLLTTNNLPRAIDLSLYQDGKSIPFTLSSNLLAALWAALTHTDWQEKHARIIRVAARLRQQLKERSITLLDQTEDAATAVITVVLPTAINGVALCQALRHNGYILAGESSYLQKRNWIQICLFGEFDDGALDALPDVMKKQMEKCQQYV
jgi:aspartate aminotransferase-like enzyme